MFDKPMRKRDPQETHDAILAATDFVLAEEGIDRATLRSIADRAGVTVPGVLYYFESKEKLLQALCDSQLAQLMQRVQQAGSALCESRNFVAYVAQIERDMCQYRIGLRIWFQQWGGNHPFRKNNGRYVLRSFERTIASALSITTTQANFLVNLLAPILGRNIWATPDERCALANVTDASLAAQRLSQQLQWAARAGLHAVRTTPQLAATPATPEHHSTSA